MLVLFDVDGTLTLTESLDAEAYARAFRAVFGADLPGADWSGYRFPTDRGIAEEAVGRLRLDPGRIPLFQRRFASDLSRRLGRGGARPVAGASEMLDRLERDGHAVALATGAWERSARLKLGAAGIRIGRRILVGSDFHPDRKEVLREARRRSGGATSARYVGDGLWDVRAARAVGLPFVGVDAAGTGELRAAGVDTVVEDYRDQEAFLSALATATVP